MARINGDDTIACARLPVAMPHRVPCGRDSFAGDDSDGADHDTIAAATGLGTLAPNFCAHDDGTSEKGTYLASKIPT